MRNRNRFRQFNASVTMRIGGEVVNKIAARYDYRCAECLGELDYWNNGLACKSNKEHRFFVHKRDAAIIQERWNTTIAALEAIYEIKDGILQPKGGLAI